MSCALVALVAPREQLRRPQLLVRELSRCEALQGHPKILLLLSSAPRGVWVGRDPICEGAGGGKPRYFLQADSLLLPSSP